MNTSAKGLPSNSELVLKTLITSILAPLSPAIPAFAIVGGQNVELGSHPFAKHVVALQMSELQEDGSTRFYKASGVLIAPDIVLTAAHNVVYIPEPSNVSAIFSSAPCWGENTCKELRISAVRTLFHSDFRQTPGGTENDVALVKLTSRAPSQYEPLEYLRSSNTVDVRSFLVLGFGKDTQISNPPLSSFRLRTISLSLFDKFYRLGSQMKFWLDQSTGGICAGDSGGPAIAMVDKVPVVVGVASHVVYRDGNSDCLSKGAFADTGYFRTWIQDAVLKLENE